MAEELTAVQPDRREDGGLPVGTVTFLFTDIAGSTRLVREDREAYAAALAEHRRLLRAAFAAHGGREVDTQGDAFFVAFPTAGQAVAAAADGQRSLLGTVPVRMGLHTGEAALAGGYVGLDVHRAARIAAAAAGGQTLLSGTTAALAAEQLPAGTALRSLGEHRLKDFPQPAALYQLDVDGLPTAFPPPRTLPRRPVLPVSPGALLGRDDDVTALASLLRNPQTRLVTVTGPGGIGKTRLALEAARAVASDFPGGAVFVPLSAITNTALVLTTLADAVGAPRERDVEPADGLRTALGDDRTLLVIDNFEQVVGAAKDLATLLEEVPAAVALVTSRQVLRLRSELQYPLATLAQAAAIKLFAERAAAVRPSFAVDPTNEAAVAEICRRLDGLPLAIELAAARVRLLPPATLLGRLTDRLDLLVGGPVDVPERQRTLRATMNWSFDLLTPHEQALFTRLGVFSGGWTLDAAESVCGRPGEPDILGTLSALLDASLLTDPENAAPEPRLDMLETVRGFAADKLAASPDRAETERRHTAWLLAGPLVPASGDRFREAFERFDRERANVRAAVQRAISTDLDTAALLIRNALRYLTLRDIEREASGWLDRALLRAPEAPPTVRGRLLVLRAVVAAVLGDTTAVLPLLEEGTPLLPDDAAHTLDRNIAGMAGLYAAVSEGSWEQAAQRSDEEAARFAALGMERELTGAAITQANVALLRGDLDGAERHHGVAQVRSRRLGDETLIAQADVLHGLILLARGDVPRARRSILDGAAVIRRGGQPTGIAYALEGLAAVALVEAHPNVAAPALAAAAHARRNVTATLFPLPGIRVDALAAQARDQLGQPAYETTCAEGRGLPLLQVLDRTLKELVDTDRPSDIVAFGVEGMTGAPGSNP